MKEAAISAGALIGLLAFAGIYNHSQTNRAKRDLHLAQRPSSSNVADVADEAEFSESSQFEDLHDIVNMTETDWAEMQAGLGMDKADFLPFTVDDEDVQAKQRRRKKNKGNPTLTRFRLNDVPNLHTQMVNTHKFRMERLLRNFVEDSGIKAAEKTPVEMLSADEQASAHVVNGLYPDFSGIDKTSPTVQKFLDQLGYDDKRIFNTGQSQVWFLVPAAVPLFGDQNSHVSDFSNYFNFIQNFKSSFDAGAGRVRLSIGLYHKGAVMSPRGAIYRKNFPWARIKSFYSRPRTTTSMPSIIPTAASITSWIPRYGSATPSAGQDCFTVWFHQDFAADANQLLVPEEFSKIDALYQMCNVIHVFVGMDRNDPAVKGYAAALVPGLQTKVAKDPEFSGVFFADSLAEMGSSEFADAVQKYTFLIKSRSGCRLSTDGYVAPTVGFEDAFGDATVPGIGGAPTDAATAFPPAEATTGAAGTDAALLTVAEDSIEATAEATAALATVDAGLAGSVAPTGDFVRGITEMVTAKVPEIDSCCGHDVYSGIPYDSELRTCCEDGSAASFSDAGGDPCMSVGFDIEDGFGDYSFKKK
jgi:hypothetical protein